MKMSLLIIGWKLFLLQNVYFKHEITGMNIVKMDILVQTPYTLHGTSWCLATIQY